MAILKVFKSSRDKGDKTLPEKQEMGLHEKHQ